MADSAHMSAERQPAFSHGVLTAAFRPQDREAAVISCPCRRVDRNRWPSVRFAGTWALRPRGFRLDRDFPAAGFRPCGALIIPLGCTHRSGADQTVGGGRILEVNTCSINLGRKVTIQYIRSLEVGGTSVPLLVAQTAVAAGYPSPAQDYFDGTINLSEHLIHDTTSTFIVRVSGCSMEGAGISDGDELIVNRARKPVDGGK